MAIKAFKVFAVVLALVAVLLAASPGIVYLIGLGNIEGRPEPSAQTADPALTAAFWRKVEKTDVVTVQPLTPWTYFSHMEHKSASGAHMAWLVARNYNYTHLKNKRTIWWHLSGASLTIWLTRHWSAEQLLQKAYEVTPPDKPRKPQT